MINLIKKKLRQETGASITFALLLFLVCAVASSLVLTAATAASGRMSKTAEYDQRYYSVTSAAELMKAQLDGKIVSIVKVTTGTKTTKYTDGIAGETTDNGDSAEKIYLVADNNAAGITDDDLTNTRQIVGEGENAANIASLRAASILQDAAYFCAVEESGDKDLTRTLKLSSSEATESGDPLAALIEETVDTAGNITLTIFNDGAEKYTVRMVFAADHQTNTGTRTADGPRENIVESAGQVTYDVTTTVTTTEVTTLTWQLTGIETVTVTD